MSPRIVRMLEIGLFPVLWITRKLLSMPALWWKRGVLAVISASVGVVVSTRFFGPHGTLGDSPWSNAGSGLSAVALGVCIATLYLLGVWGLDPVAVGAVRRVARLLPVAGNGAFAVARHTLDSQRSFQWRDFWTSNAQVGSLVFMALIMSGYTAGFTIDRAQLNQIDALAFDAVVTRAGAAVNQSGIGVDRSAINPAVIAALAADPNLVVVPFGNVTVGPVGASAPTASITIVSPGDLDRVTPDGARPLGFQDGVLLSPDREELTDMLPAPIGLIDVSTGVGAATLFHRTWFNASTIATRAWAESTWGDVPVVGALVMYVGHDLPAADRFGYVADAARGAGAEAQPAPALASTDIAFHRSNETFSLGFLRVMAVFVVVASGIGAVLLSVRTVKAHRQVRATVAALGATPRSLALSVPIDAGITHAVAFAIGVPIGVIVAAMIKYPTLLTPGAPLDPGTTAWGLWWNLTHIAWGPIAAVVGATWLLVVAATTVYGLRVARRTPVDELRVAIKEGAV